MYSHESQETMQTLLDIIPIDHTRKQCQMHVVATNVTQRLKKYAPTEFGVEFNYNRVCNDRYLPSNCQGVRKRRVSKIYVNKTGESMVQPNNEPGTLYEKAQI